MIIGGLGDSNTQAHWPTVGTLRWVEYAAGFAPAWTWRNYGAGGGTVCDPGLPWPWAQPQLAQAIAAGCTHVIAAFGTNDILVLAKTRDQIIEGYCALVAAAEAAGLVPLIATTPRCDVPGAQVQIDALNQRLLLLEKNYGWHLVDFDSGDLVDALALPDLVHVSDAAQTARAMRAVDALLALEGGFP